MRINPAGNSVPPQYKRLDSNPAAEGGGAASSTGDAVAKAAASTSIQLDSIRDLSQLLQQSVADVRESVVEAVKLKVQAGEYLTKEAAASTAQKLLDL
ncbi:MAG: flagellar biosynthesis anti-sigma factor FlgM [Planctomycetota bacterium]